MIRVLGVPTAVVAVVVVPLIALAAQSETKQPAPEPKEAALTLRLAGTEGSSGDPAIVRLTAVGAAPAADKTFKLADDTGLHSADVSAAGAAADKAACKKAKLRATGLEGRDDAKEWCLRFTDVDVGAELKGTVPSADVGTGPATLVAFTVTRRHAFLGWPLATLILGLLAGLLVILVPRLLSRFVKRIVLSSLVEENEADPNARLAGLADWVNERLAGGATEADSAAAIAPVIRRGPAAAADARRKLRREIDASGISPDNPLIAGAIRQSEQTTNDISDFVDEAAKPIPHPATKWLSAVKRLTEVATLLENAERRIAALAQPCQADPTTKLEQARVTFGDIAAPSDIGRLEDRLNALRTSIENAEANPECADVGVADAAAPASIELSPASGLQALIIDRNELYAASLEAKFACGILILIIAGFAAVTVALSAYEPKHTFSSTTDYFLLFSAALGSGAAATVLAVFGWWQATSAEKGS